MLNLIGKQRFAQCDGISRRAMLKAGALGIGGLTLPELLRQRAEAATAGKSLPKTSIIYLELAGGPTHFETYDPKPEAPQEFRGPLGTTSTNVPGTFFSEMMTEQAKVADKLTVVRSITHSSSSHGTSSHLTQTGYYLRDRQRRQNDMPSTGSITSMVRGPNAPGMPAYVALPRVTRFGGAAYIGKQYNPLETGGDPNRKDFQVKNVGLLSELDLDRLEDRRGLLDSLDHQRTVLDLENTAGAFDEYAVQAFDMVSGDRARDAFDIAQEQDALRDRYGRSAVGQSMLLARRLIESGVTFVTVRVPGWDMHNKIEDRIKSTGAGYDRAAAALISDLHERGLNRDVLVVAMGEFGRTPRINKNAGRDHWGKQMSVMLSGGKYQMGQTIGASNSKGEYPEDRPYRPENVLEMMYRHLGIDSQSTFPDHSGRPRYILESREPIPELG